MRSPETLIARLRRRARRIRIPLIDYSLAPRDRILSAVSADGVQWTREAGIRRDVGGVHDNEMVYYACVVPASPGAYRMYYYGSTFDGAWRGRIVSAVSRDGLTWSDEPGVRVPFGGLHDAHHAQAPAIVRLGDGSLRLYYCGIDRDGLGRILSASSRDGISWQKEGGIRLDSSQVGDASTVLDCSVVALAGGAFRMYATVLTGAHPMVCSVTSDDGLRWNQEHGVRVGRQPGHPAVARNPCVLRHDSGWRMYFSGGDHRVVGNDIYMAGSADGLQWSVEGIVLPHSGTHPFERHAVAFPFVTVWPGIGWRMYYTGYWGRHLRERRTLAQWQ